MLRADSRATTVRVALSHAEPLGSMSSHGKLQALVLESSDAASIANAFGEQGLTGFLWARHVESAPVGRLSVELSSRGALEMRVREQARRLRSRESLDRRPAGSPRMACIFLGAVRPARDHSPRSMNLLGVALAKTSPRMLVNSAQHPNANGVCAHSSRANRVDSRIPITRGIAEFRTLQPVEVSALAVGQLAYLRSIELCRLWRLERAVSAARFELARSLGCAIGRAKYYAGSGKA